MWQPYSLTLKKATVCSVHATVLTYQPVNFELIQSIQNLIENLLLGHVYEEWQSALTGLINHTLLQYPKALYRGYLIVF